jgi:TonB family protein
MSAEQRTAIRDWARTAKAEPEVSVAPASSANRVEVRKIQTGRGSFGGGGRGGRRGQKNGWLWIAILALAFVAVVAFWWRWTRGWQELESGLKGAISADKAKVQVPTEVMQRLLVHRVDPVYPVEARKENLQGIIALDIVVSTDGSVVSMRALNGPDVLAKAAMDSLRWWKFEPYRVNGEPVTAETTVAVEFKE